MKKAVVVCLLVAMALPSPAVEDGNVRYVGGTVASLQEGALGKWDTRSQSELAFECSGSKLAIPFAKIDSYEYSQHVAHHLGICRRLGWDS